MERIGTLLVAPTAERKAEPGRFGEALRSAAGAAASGVATSVALAAPFVPGGPVLAGAVRAAAAPALASAVRAATAGAPAAAGSATAASGDSGGDVLEATRALQQQAQTFNLQYLQLQEAIQRESREFTSLTNVMKVKHDSAKAAINNIH
jgi:hypothetical protein